MSKGRTVAQQFVRASWGAMCALLVVGLLGGPVGAAEKPLERVGRLDVSIPGLEAVSSSYPNYGLIFDSPRRRAYQIYQADEGMFGRIFDLDSRKLLRTRKLPDEAFDQGPVSPIGGAPSEWLHALDPQTGTIYLPYRAQGSFGGIVALAADTLDVVDRLERQTINLRFDPENPAASACTSSACLPQVPMIAPVIRGLSFVPSELSGQPPKLILLSEEGATKPPGTERNQNTVWLTQWDIATARQDYNYRVQSCASSQLPSAPDTAYQLGIFQARLGAGVYLACAASGGTGQAVKINFDLNGQPSTEQAFPGPQSLVDAIPDAESDRMVMRVSNEEGESVWVFDGSALAYTGVVGITVSGANTANGIDPITGRFYAVTPPTRSGAIRTPGGLLMSDVRRSPAPQALAFPEFAQAAIGAIRVDTDPATGDRFVYFMPASGTVYTIVEDNVPISEDVSVRDLDALTIDVEEEAGVTGRNFTGSGHAYGLQVLFVGGLHGLPPTGPDLSGVRVGRHGIQTIGSPCGPGDRRLVLGFVKDASLSNNAANATAAVGETDELTRADSGEPIGRCYPEPRDPTPNNRGGSLWDSAMFQLRVRFPQQWQALRDQAKAFGLPDPDTYPRPLDKDTDGAEGKGDGVNDYDETLGTPSPFHATQCSGDDGRADLDVRTKPLNRSLPGDPADEPTEGDEEEEPTVRDTEVLVPGADAFVECRQSKARVESATRFVIQDQTIEAFENRNVPGLGHISVGEISSKVIIYLDPTRGLVTRAEAAVRGLSLGDEVFIDQAYTIAEAWAAGRYGTASTSFDRAICGVRIKDQLPKVVVNRPAADVYQDNVQADPIYEVEASPSPRASADPQATIRPEATPQASVDPTGGGRVDKKVDLGACNDPVTHPQGQIGVLDVINRALGSRGRAVAPDPDGELAQGTPGGYLASVQKDRLDKISSTAVNNDKSDQVPAFELVLFNDDNTEGRGRQIYQFAGVDATVTYGIYLLNPDEVIFDDPGCPACGAPLPGVVTPPTFPGSSDPGSSGLPRHRGPVTILYEGVNFLLRSPLDMLLAAAVWGVLFSPVQLSWRRRMLKALR